MKLIKDNIYYCGFNDYDRVIFDELIPLDDGTTYNSYFIKGSKKNALIDTMTRIIRQFWHIFYFFTLFCLQWICLLAVCQFVFVCQYLPKSVAISSRNYQKILVCAKGILLQ